MSPQLKLDKRSSFKYKKSKKEKTEIGNLLEIEMILNQINSNSQKLATNQSIKFHKWNCDEPLKIGDEVMALTLQKSSFDIEKTKKTLRKNGIHAFNGVIQNRTKTEIQNLEVKFEENEGINFFLSLIKLKFLDFTFNIKKFEFIQIHEGKEEAFSIFLKPHLSSLDEKDRSITVEFSYMYLTKKHIFIIT